jgi:chaperonin cofactor prefoldin
MAHTLDEKSVRLQAMLKEAVLPLTEKLESLEHEIAALKESQERMNRMIETLADRL